MSSTDMRRVRSGNIGCQTGNTLEKSGAVTLDTSANTPVMGICPRSWSYWELLQGKGVRSVLLACSAI
jgi:hypothetical protein